MKYIIKKIWHSFLLFFIVGFFFYGIQYTFGEATEPLYPFLFEQLLQDDTVNSSNSGLVTNALQSEQVLCGANYTNGKSCKVALAETADSTSGGYSKIVRGVNCIWGPKWIHYAWDQEPCNIKYGHGYAQVGFSMQKSNGYARRNNMKCCRLVLY